jgi:hypothetical protein
VKTPALVLIGIGAFILYRVFRSGLSTLVPGSSGSSSSGGSSSTGSSTGSTDSGSHQAIDTSGAVTGQIGSVYTVDSTYADATDQQKDDMNAFAHANPNGSSG